MKPAGRIKVKKAGKKLAQFPINHPSAAKDSILQQAAGNLDRFLASVLTTEKSHPDTNAMAERAKQDDELKDIVSALQGVDEKALTVLMSSYLNSTEYTKLVAALKVTLQSGGRVFLAGCGSSGRLALFIEKICRDKLPSVYKSRVIAVIAGGDYALVRAIEHFEDNGEYASRQLTSQGFNPATDLYIGISASGSAKFINHAIWQQARRVRKGDAPAHLKPWLVCCNDAETLTRLKQEQFALAKITNPDAPSPHPLADCTDYMCCLGLDVGPNALAGSSRMQSATVTELALYYAILEASAVCTHEQAKGDIQALVSTIKKAPLSDTLDQLVMAAAACYQGGQFVMCRTDAESAITGFIDRTECSPTFQLPKIENAHIPQAEWAWCSLSINGVAEASRAFAVMLGREPMALAWDDEPCTHPDILNGFDFSSTNAEVRAARTGVEHQILSIEHRDNAFSFCFGSDNATAISIRLPTVGLNDFTRQVYLKMILNIHSTLVMGRLGRYRSNRMTNLSTSNAKLFARNVRLVSEDLQAVARQNGLDYVSRQFVIPHIPVSYPTQAIAAVVALFYMKDLANQTERSQQTSLTERSVAFFIKHADILVDNSSDIETLQQEAQQEIVFDDLHPYGDVNHEARQQKLTAFFQLRCQVSVRVLRQALKEQGELPGLQQ